MLDRLQLKELITSEVELAIANKELIVEFATAGSQERFAAQLRALRVAKGLSQLELAAMANLEPLFVEIIETISYSEFIGGRYHRLIKALGCLEQDLAISCAFWLDETELDNY